MLGGWIGALGEDIAPPLILPDAMRSLGDGRLLVVSGAGLLLEVAIEGTSASATTVAEGLNMPSSVALVDGERWVSEGQAGILFGLAEGPPSTPFVLRRF